MPSAEALSLKDRRVLVARAPSRARPWVEALTARGAEVEACGTFTLESMVGDARSQRALDEIDRYDWVLFTSRNGLRFFLRGLRARGLRLAGLSARYAAVGPQTAEALEAEGVAPDTVARQPNALGLAAALKGAVTAGERVLIVRPQRTRPELAEQLEAMGAEVHSVPFYRNRAARDLGRIAAELSDKNFDAAAFGAPSAFGHLFAACGDRAHEWFASLALVAIGETTAAAIRDRGCEVAAVARQPTPEGIADAVEQAVSR
jgi:uroporphyrinogen-III synthase